MVLSNCERSICVASAVFKAKILKEEIPLIHKGNGTKEILGLHITQTQSASQDSRSQCHTMQCNLCPVILPAAKIFKFKHSNASQLLPAEHLILWYLVLICADLFLHAKPKVPKGFSELFHRIITQCIYSELLNRIIHNASTQFSHMIQ